MTLTDAQAAAFYNNRKRRRGRADDIRFAAFNSSHPIVLTRASEAWAFGKRSNYAGDNDRTLYAYGNNEKRVAYGELTLTGAATRLHGEFPVNGQNFSVVSIALGKDGLFSPHRIETTTGDLNAQRNIAFAATNAQATHCRVLVAAGSSGNVRISCRVNATESIIDGAVDSAAVIQQLAGTITGLVITPLKGGLYLYTFTFTANATTVNASFGVGPSSVTIGQSVLCYGAQIVNASYAEWIMGGDGTKAQAADAAVLQVPDGTWNVLLTFFDGTQDIELLQVVTGGTGWPIPTNYDKPITQISAVLP